MTIFLYAGYHPIWNVLTEELKKHFFVEKTEIVSLRHEHQRETHFLKRRICVDDFGWHVELDQKYVESLLDAMGMDNCRSMATPRSKEQERHAASDKLDPKKHQEFRSGAGICQYMTEQRFDSAFITKEIMRAAAGPTTSSKMKLKRITRFLKGRQRCVLNFPWVAQLEDVIHVTVDQIGLETQRQGAPRLEESWLLVRASLFVIGRWHKRHCHCPQLRQKQRQSQKVALKDCM